MGRQFKEVLFHDDDKRTPSTSGVEGFNHRKFNILMRVNDDSVAGLMYLMNNSIFVQVQ